MGREVVGYQMMEHKIRLTSVLSLHVNISGYVHFRFRGTAGDCPS